MSAYDYEVCPQGLSTVYGECNLNVSFLSAHIKERLLSASSIKILELGSGGGRNLSEIHKIFDGAVELFGTDISASAIDYASSLGIGKFCVATSDTNPFREEFDLILMIDLLEHLESMDAVSRTMNNAMRYLNKDGCIFISVPIELNKYSLAWFFNGMPYLRNLTREFFGHTLRFDIPGFLGFIDHKKVVLDKIFYSVHFLNHIQMLLFFYIPKILIKLFLGKQMSDRLRDSSEITRGGRRSFLIFLKRAFVSLGYPLARLSVNESILRKYSTFAAGNMHLMMRKREA